MVLHLRSSSSVLGLFPKEVLASVCLHLVFACCVFLPSGPLNIWEVIQFSITLTLNLALLVGRLLESV